MTTDFRKRGPVYSSPIKYMGIGFMNGCKVGSERYTSSYRAVLSDEEVTSYRGPVDKEHAHEFTSYKFRCVTGNTAPVWTCCRGYTDGGNSWGLFLPAGHPLFNPQIPNWGLGLVKSLNLTSYRDYLVQSLFAKANEPLFASATFLAELKETVTYILSRGYDILRKTLQLRNYLLKLHKRESAAGLWLEWRYAILPILLDIEAILNLLEKKRKRSRIHDGFEDRAITASSDHRFTFDVPGLPDPVYTFTMSTATKYKGGAGLKVLDQMDLNPYGSSLQDVIAAGWERVPYSFVVDWFFDVGQWLGSLRDTNLVWSNCYCTIVAEVTGEIALTKLENCSEIYSIGQQAPPVEFEAYVMKRFLVSSPPSAPMLVPLRLSLLRSIDALALISSTLAGMKFPGRR